MTNVETIRINNAAAAEAVDTLDVVAAGVGAGAEDTIRVKIT